MDFILKIRDEVNAALKGGESEKARLNVLRLLLSELKNEKINSQKEVDEEAAFGVIRREVKKRRQAVEEYTKLERSDLAEKEQSELDILQQYLPPEMDEQAVSDIVRQIVGGLGEVSEKDFGKVMGLVMKELKGKADGQLINKTVKSVLSGS